RRLGARGAAGAPGVDPTTGRRAGDVGVGPAVLVAPEVLQAGVALFDVGAHRVDPSLVVVAVGGVLDVLILARSGIVCAAGALWCVGTPADGVGTVGTKVVHTCSPCASV